MRHQRFPTALRLLSAAMTTTLAAHACAQPLSISFKNTLALPDSATDQFGTNFTVTGLSGISYRGVDADGVHRFLAVMDNSSKLIDLAVTFNAGGSITSASIVSGFTLAESRDFEDVVAMPPSRHSVLLSEEDTPALREYSLSTGALLGAFPTPAVYLGRRANFGFESVTRSRDGTDVWTANEEALTADGSLSTASTGTLVRLLRYSVSGGVATPAQQFAYLTAPIHGTVIMGSRSGVSALVSLPDGRLLSLERSLAGPFPSFQSRIYEVTPAAATDVSAMPSLVGQSFTPVTKSSLYQGNQTNMEGLCVGPLLSAGVWSLLGIVDDGDHLLSTNRLVAFTLSGVTADAPCTADYNGDAFVNGDDFDLFIERFVAGDPSADIDLNSFVNGVDFDAFVERFVAGC